ncbi:ATP-binding protein, partial [Lichenifustis flavocetrariae]
HEMSRLFERFHRIEGQRSRSFEGSGIGLALVHDLVRLHGGTIEASSEPSVGTVFTVKIPFRVAQISQSIGDV